MSEQRVPCHDRYEALAPVFRPSSGPSRSGSGSRLWVRVGVPMSVAFFFTLVFFVGNPCRLSLFTHQETMADRPVIAVMHFDNLADPPDYDRTAQMITSLMITGLSESPHISVISRQRLSDLLRKLGRAGAKGLDPAMAAELGRRSGVRWLLTGSVLRTEPHVVLVSSIANAKDGTVVASQRVDGAVGEDLFAVVERLCASVCQDLSLSEGADPNPGNERLARVTTCSPDAYRAYLEGEDFKDEADYELALQSFERAVQLDTTFAIAYYNLAQVQRALERFDDAKVSLERAAQYAGEATVTNRLYIQSLRAQVDGDYGQAAAYLTDLTGNFPQEKQAFVELGAIYYRQFRINEAIAMMEQALALDSSFSPALKALAYAYHFGGQYDRSISTANRYVEIAPNDPDPYDTRGEIQAMNGLMDDAIASYTEALRRKPDCYHAVANLGHLYLFKDDYRHADSLYRVLCISATPELRAAGRKYLAFIPLSQGKLDEALAVLDWGLTADEADDAPGQNRAMKHELKARILAAGEDYDRALAETAIENELNCDISPSSCYASRAHYIQLLVDSGRWTEARDSLRSLERQVEDCISPDIRDLAYARGIIARAHGDNDLAIENFRVASRTHGFRPRLELAKTLLADNQLGEAVTLFEGLAGTWCEDRAAHLLGALESEYLLGDAYERSGRTIEAEKQFERYVTLCGTNARRSPRVADALTRLSRLASAE